MKTNFPFRCTAAAACLVFFTCCQSGPKPEDAALDFLNAYLSTDYVKAASYCTATLSGKLLEAVAELDRLEPNIKDQIANSTRQLTLEINNVEKSGRGDTLLVSYSICKPAPDSTLAPAGTVRSILSLVKEEENWKVAALNKL